MGIIHAKSNNSYVFLDIDGVLNCSETRTAEKSTHMPQENLLNNLKNISDNIPNLIIILSSTWRLNEKSRKLVDHYLSKINLKVLDITSDKSLDASGDRPDEILEYVQLNNLHNKPWIAIDDMPMLDMNSKLKGNNFCKTDDRYGLTYDKSLEVINKLKSQKQ